MILAFIAGAATLGMGILIGVGITHGTYDRVLKRGGD